uniref:DUF4283 domain-containing protein n=1 Tax=Cannabis sativa TaxID=3483 RepID=A0A803Q5E5_CANSA
MASSSQNASNLADQYAEINIEGEEEGILIEDEAEGDELVFDDRWCLIGRFLTGRSIDFDAKRHLMASLWQPGKGVYVKELETNLYLFQFYHELHIQSVIDGSPWTFNKFPLVFHRLKSGENPRAIHIHKLDMWVQIHDLRSGFMMDKVVRSAGGYIGTYVKSDPKNFNGIWRDYLRVRATIDIEKPLKRRMKLCKEKGDWIWATFKYEHLPTFCYICGIIGHAERKEDFGRLVVAPLRSEIKTRSNEMAKIMDVDPMISGSKGREVITAKGNQGSNGVDIVSDNYMGNVTINNNGDKVNLQNNELVIVLENKKRLMDMRVIENYVEVEKECDGSVGLKNLMQDVIERVRVAIGFEGAIGVDAHGKSGGVALLWRIADEVQVLGYGVNYIDALVKSSDTGDWRLTGMYGEPNRSLRQKTWDLIRSLKEEQEQPWCIIGDLNNVTSQQDKRGGNAYPNWLINGFCGMLDDCGLHDLDLEGYPFTLERGRGTDDWIEVRIDRALVSQQWLDLFPTAKLINLEVSTSDHCPLILVPVNMAAVTGSRVFRFKNSWLKEPLCHKIVEETWEQYTDSSIMEKIKNCANVLADWGKDYTGNFKKRIKECKAEIRLWKKGRDPVAVAKY